MPRTHEEPPSTLSSPQPVKPQPAQEPLEITIDPGQFTNTTVLLTGATGFLGRVILSTLLAKTPANIVLLVRPTGTQSAAARIEKLLSTSAFAGLDVPAESGRLRVLPADLAQPGLGLCPGAWESAATWAQSEGRLLRVIHCASSVRFEDPLEKLFPVNVRAVVRLTELLDSLPTPVQSFVYISTGTVHSFSSILSYICCPRNNLLTLQIMLLLSVTATSNSLRQLLSLGCERLGIRNWIRHTSPPSPRCRPVYQRECFIPRWQSGIGFRRTRS